MMTGTPIESNVWMAYLLTVFLVVTGFAVYDILYRRVPDRALVFFIPLAALAPLIQVYFILEYDRMPIFIWPVVTEALMGALLGFCLAYGIERKYIRFETKAVWWAQILKFVLGLALTLAILKLPVKHFVLGGLPIGHFFEYFLAMGFASIVWPMTFSFFSRPGGRK